MYRYKFVFWLLLGALLGGILVRPVYAHGGGIVYVSGEAAGPYQVTVWVAPNTVEAGKTLHFTVAVVQPGSNEPVLDAAVQMVVLADGSETAVISGPATTAQSVNKLFYEADFAAPAESGRYQVQTQVRGPEGEGAVSFALTVEAAQRSNMLLIGLGGVLLVAAAGFFLSRRSAKAVSAD